MYLVHDTSVWKKSFNVVEKSLLRYGMYLMRDEYARAYTVHLEKFWRHGGMNGSKISQAIDTKIPHIHRTRPVETDIAFISLKTTSAYWPCSSEIKRLLKTYY